MTTSPFPPNLRILAVIGCRKMFEGGATPRLPRALSSVLLASTPIEPPQMIALARHPGVRELCVRGDPVSVHAGDRSFAVRHLLMLEGEPEATVDVERLRDAPPPPSVRKLTLTGCADLREPPQGLRELWGVLVLVMRA